MSTYFSPKKEAPSSGASSVFATPQGQGGLPGGGSTDIPSESASLSTNGTSIVVIDIDQDFGVGNGKMCGGMVGRKGSSEKMCIKTGCTIAKHQDDSGKWEASEMGTGRIVFIRANEPNVYTKPTIPARLIDDEALRRYLTETRSVEEWTVLFEVLRNQGNEMDEDSKKELTDFEKRLDGYAREAKTPYKKRSNLDVVSPDLAEQFGMMHLTLESEIAEPFEQDLRVQWKTLVTLFTELSAKVNKLEASLVGLSEGTKSEFAKFDIHVFRLTNDLGEKPKDFATMTVFELLSNLFKEVETLGNQQGSIPGVDTSAINRMEKGILILFDFLNSWSHTTPGDHLKKSISDLEVNMKHLQSTLQRMQQSQPTPSTATAGLQQSGFFHPKAGPTTGNPIKVSFGSQATSGIQSVGGTTMQMNLGGTSQDQRLAALEATLHTLQADLNTTKSDNTRMRAQIKDLQDQAKTTTVVINGMVFPTQSAAGAWLVQHVPNELGYMFFMDAHTMLAIVHDFQLQGMTSGEQLKQNNEALKSGLKSRFESSVISSFSTPLPALFGRVTADKMLTQDARILPGLTSHVKWGTAGSYESAARTIKDSVTEVSVWLQSQVGEYVSGEPKLLATYMIMHSASYICNMADWMSREFDVLVERGGKKEDSWMLLSQLTRGLFAELHRVRLVGRVMQFGGDYSSIESHHKRVFWGSLQGFARLERFANAGFSSDPTLGTELFKYLRDNSVLKSDKDDLISSIKKLQDSVKTIGGTAEKALAASYKKKGKDNS